MAEVSRATIDYRVDFLAKKKLRTSKLMIHTYRDPHVLQLLVLMLQVV